MVPTFLVVEFRPAPIVERRITVTLTTGRQSPSYSGL
jgi:hypothetical protein